MAKTNSGINTNLGSACSKTAFAWAKGTFNNRKKNGVMIPTVDGAYASMMDCNGSLIGISSDGIGTKVEIAERMKKYDTLGYDLLAMTIDDLVSNGFEPVSISNILDVDHLDHATVDALMHGLHDAAKFSRVIVTGGEIAELGSRISGYGKGMHFNWCATGMGILHPNLKQPLNGMDILPGDAIISIYNPGFRSNGFSLLRKILTEKYGENWHTKTDKRSNMKWGDAALTPCLIYSPVVVKLLSKLTGIHGIAHITGGGVVDNLGRLLKHKALGADLNNLFTPEPYFESLIKMGNVPLGKAYQYWNMGNGMLIILPAKEVKKALKIINGTEPYKAQLAGYVTDRKLIEITIDNTILPYTTYDTK